MTKQTGITRDEMIAYLTSEQETLEREMRTLQGSHAVLMAIAEICEGVERERILALAEQCEDTIQSVIQDCFEVENQLISLDAPGWVST